MRVIENLRPCALILVFAIAACSPQENAVTEPDKTSEVEKSADVAPSEAAMPAADSAEAAAPTYPNYVIDQPTTLDSGLVIIQRAAGDGTQAVPGNPVTVHYTGWLHDESAPEQKGNKFDSSRDKDRPFRFTLGARKVIPGWDAGVAGMRVGDQRTLVIPATMAYGARGVPRAGIPPNATLLFDVELLGVER